MRQTRASTNVDEGRKGLPEYRDVKLKKELAEAIELFLTTNRHFGYRSLAQFVEDASRKRLENLGGLKPLKPMRHFNLDEDGVKIVDSDLNRVVGVFFKPEGVWCDFDEADSCKHIDYALRNPEVQKVIRKKRLEGWKLPEV